MQSHYAADLYLSALRSALFLDMRDITRSNMLIEIARQVNKSHRDHFEFQRFGKDFSSKGSRIALKADFEKARVNSIIHCPTITFTIGGRGIKLTGSRTYAQLLSALSKISENQGRSTAANDQ
ncbi:DsbA family protein [Dyadobacter sp. CY261]|nr:DsbA family protein [Dyadobacter sp. CY261]